MSSLNGKVVCLIYLLIFTFVYVCIYFGYTKNKRFSPFILKGGNLINSKDETGGKIIKPIIEKNEKK